MGGKSLNVGSEFVDTCGVYAGFGSESAVRGSKYEFVGSRGNEQGVLSAVVSY